MDFTIVMTPVGKARPRFTRGGHAYTDRKTVEAERLIRAEYIRQGGEYFKKGVPVKVEVAAFFPIPKSYPAKKKLECMQGIRQPTKKPDGDNIMKLVLDALNGVAYEDDAQVTRQTISKDYVSSLAYTTGLLNVRISERKR